MTPPSPWPLAVVLELARRRELGARVALGEALAGAARLRGEEDAAREAWHAARRATGAALARGTAPAADLAAAALEGAARFVAGSAAAEARLAAALRRREAAHAEALAVAERSRAALGDARAAVRALEGRRDAWRAERARVRARAEDDATDEVVSARWRGAS